MTHVSDGNDGPSADCHSETDKSRTRLLMERRKRTQETRSAVMDSLSLLF